MSGLTRDEGNGSGIAAVRPDGVPQTLRSGTPRRQGEHGQQEKYTALERAQGVQMKAQVNHPADFDRGAGQKSIPSRQKANLAKRPTGAVAGQSPALLLRILIAC